MLCGHQNLQSKLYNTEKSEALFTMSAIKCVVSAVLYIAPYHFLSVYLSYTVNSLPFGH